MSVPNNFPLATPHNPVWSLERVGEWGGGGDGNGDGNGDGVIIIVIEMMMTMR